MAEHTSGPWSWHNAGGEEAFSLRVTGSAQGIIIPALAIEPGYEKQVAEAKRHAKLLCIVPQEADARLIAAAPTLLAACRAALELLDQRGKFDGPTVITVAQRLAGIGGLSTAARLRHAIERAEGGGE